MRADRCGTMAEQARYDAGWETAAKIPAAARCDNCVFSDGEQRERSTSWRCTKHGFATKANGRCRSYKDVRPA